MYRRTVSQLAQQFRMHSYCCKRFVEVYCLSGLWMCMGDYYLRSSWLQPAL